jgi:hypothetical protein
VLGVNNNFVDGYQTASLLELLAPRILPFIDNSESTSFRSEGFRFICHSAPLPKMVGESGSLLCSIVVITSSRSML